MLIGIKAFALKRLFFEGAGDNVLGSVCYDPAGVISVHSS